VTGGGGGISSGSSAAGTSSASDAAASSGSGTAATGAATGGTVPPLPADMPLAPGFSYGNPVAAVFNAEGHVIQGAEVVSTTNTTQNGGALGQFYATRLPRAGWTVDSSTIPAPTAASWSIAATSGSRVTVVQFSAGVIHIFYGTS